jgi:type IV secretory pathway VirJ component
MHRHIAILWLRVTRFAVAGSLGASGLLAQGVRVVSGPRTDDLPLVEVRAAAHTGTLAVFLSGDGGWADIDKKIGEVLAQKGIDVIGFDDRAYLRGTPRNPDGTAADVARAAAAYLARWNDQRLVLLGYSRGADLLPFVATRLPAALRARLALLVMLGLQERASFKYRFSDLWATHSRPSDIPIRPELERLRGTNMLCVYGRDEDEALCRNVDTTLVRTVARPGKHHFDGDYGAIASLILARLEPVTNRRP